jgi:hypothetical protein
MRRSPSYVGLVPILDDLHALCVRHFEEPETSYEWKLSSAGELENARFCTDSGDDAWCRNCFDGLHSTTGIRQRHRG